MSVAFGGRTAFELSAKFWTVDAMLTQLQDYPLQVRHLILVPDIADRLSTRDRMACIPDDRAWQWSPNPESSDMGSR